MKRLLATAIMLVALLAVAFPAQATGLGVRYHLGHTVSVVEIATFECTGIGPVRAFLLYHDERYTIAKAGTVRHPSRIVAPCQFATPHPGHVSP